MDSLTPDDFSSSHDPRTVKMENDLLQMENRYLKGRVASEGTRLGARADKSGRGRVDGGVVIGRDEYESLRKALYDLKWLLQRLDGTPLRVVLKRFGGWRTLMARYGRETW